MIKTVLSSSLKYAKRNHYIEDDLVTGLKWNKDLDDKKESMPKMALEVNEVIEILRCAYETELYLPMYADLSQIIKGYVLDRELLEEHQNIESLDFPKEMEELLKEC